MPSYNELKLNTLLNRLIKKTVLLDKNKVPNKSRITNSKLFFTSVCYSMTS